MSLSRGVSSWVNDWHQELVSYERRVLELDTRCHQSLLVVRAESLVEYLLECPRQCLESLRELSPLLLIDVCTHFRAFLVRCDEILSDIPADIDRSVRSLIFACLIFVVLRAEGQTTAVSVNRCSS